jgi:oxygen-dependent protoporphyrinogen oxidase
MGALIAALVEAIGAADIRLACTAEGLARDGRGWTVTTARGTERVDGVVVALPAPIAGRLLAPTAPAAAGSLAAIEYASVAIVAFAVDADAVSAPLDGSGFLVPSTAGLLLSACSSFTNKWPHLADGGTVILRASAGRAGDDRIASLDDDALARGLLADLGTTIGLRGEPREVRVSRWPRSFPQYAPGHLDRVDAIDRDLAAGGPGLAVAGAGLRGLGVPACITQGRDAARRVLASLSG